MLVWTHGRQSICKVVYAYALSVSILFTSIPSLPFPSPPVFPFFSFPPLPPILFPLSPILPPLLCSYGVWGSRVLHRNALTILSRSRVFFPSCSHKCHFHSCEYCSRSRCVPASYLYLCTSSHRTKSSFVLWYIRVTNNTPTIVYYSSSLNLL